MSVNSECNLPPADTNCLACNEPCLLECLKCRTCKKFVHTDCSLLPVYAVVTYMTTRSQFTCNGCIKQQLGDQCDRQFAIVYSLINKEKETKQQLTNDKDSSKDSENNKANTDDIPENESAGLIPTEKYSAAANERTEVQSDMLPKTNKNDDRKNKICYFYKHNQCKFGRKGRDCPYAHPNLCNKYKVNGRDPVKGCKFGDKCKYLHPPICNGSERKRECFNLECKKLHLKGTRRYQPEDPPPGPPTHPPTSASHIPPPVTETPKPQSEWVSSTQVTSNNWANKITQNYPTMHFLM